MQFSPEIVAILENKISRTEILNTHKTIKAYTKKTTKRENLEQQIQFILRSYEILYNRLNKILNPNAKTYIIDSSKIKQMKREELNAFHQQFRACMKHPKSKQQAIDNLVAFAKQIYYFTTY